MFGKNYDNEIEQLNNGIKNCDKNIGVLNKNIEHLEEMFKSIQDSMLDMAKVQAQHKQFIQFFVNHATVDADAQEDLIKMIQEMSKVEEKVKKAKK